MLLACLLSHCRVTGTWPPPDMGEAGVSRVSAQESSRDLFPSGAFDLNNALCVFAWLKGIEPYDVRGLHAEPRTAPPWWRQRSRGLRGRG